MALKWIFEAFSCGFKLDLSKEELKLESVPSEMRSRPSRVQIPELFLERIVSETICPKNELSKTIFKKPRILFLIFCFLLPQDAWNCALVLAPPQFFHELDRRARRQKFLRQIKTNVKNFVKQMNKETQIDPNNPSPVARDMDVIKVHKQIPITTFARAIKLHYIAFDLEILSRYFEKLTLEICSNYATKNEIWVYLSNEKTQCKILIDLYFPKFAHVCSKNSEIRFSSVNSSSIYQFTDECLCFSVLPCYRLK
jgi:hypothetical protein